MKLSVWLDSLVGPVLRLVKTLLIVTVPAFSAESTRLVGQVALGAWFTGLTVSVNLLVMDLVPSLPTRAMMTEPLTLVRGVTVTVNAAALVPTRRLVCVPWLAVPTVTVASAVLLE